MPRNKKLERQLPVGRKMLARNSTDIASQTINNERTTVIVDDSIIKNVQGIKLAKTVRHRVVVKPFPGEPQFATCVRMLFLQLISLLTPNLSTCGYDLKSCTPSDVPDSIIDLAREVENAFESAIVISELTSGNDDYFDAVEAVNKRLKQFCNQNNQKLISHANISSKGLNKGGLHL